MLATEPIRAERVYWWAIEQITSRSTTTSQVTPRSWEAGDQVPVMDLDWKVRA